jgi:putative heme-binding domain-containing protein
LFETISKGIPGTPMPAFPGTGREVWQVVGYVRSLSIGKGAASSKGDPVRGAKLFADQGCGGCHSVRGAGGSLGPDLAEVGTTRSLGHIRRSILNPNEDVAPDYWILRARTKTGQELSGIRLNEDTFSYQFRDQSGLRSVFKTDLAEHTIVTTSAMPSYRDKLAASDLEDVVSFLAAQKGTAAR